MLNREDSFWENHYRKHIVSLGVSDTGTFILAGCNTKGDVKVMPLNIREGQCFARIIDEDAEIHKSWNPVATFKHWFKVYDDFKLMYKIGCLKDDAVINVYNTSSNTDTIVIQRPKGLLENRGEIGVAATIRPFGKWLAERDPDTGEINCLHCSMCDSDFHHTSIMMGYPYCPNCGSKMDDLNIYEVKSMKEGTENAY